MRLEEVVDFLVRAGENGRGRRVGLVHPNKPLNVGMLLLDGYLGRTAVYIHFG